MKGLFIASLLLSSSLAYARIYYVAPNGVDGSYPTRGTLSNPWRTWHYAMNHTTPGDTCYFRGGIYPAYSTSIGVELKTTAVDGTHDHPTCFFAYPDDYAAGNYPVLDCQIMTSSGGYNMGVEISRASHLYFKGLTVKNVRQTSPYTYAAGNGWYIWNEGSRTQYAPNNLRFENCVAYNIGGRGFKPQCADTVYFINCDAYNCCDSISEYDPGGVGVGFSIGLGIDQYDKGKETYTYLYGCRAWKCSDQGFSLNSIGKIEASHCWSINNGNVAFAANTWNKGSGFKMWFNDQDVQDTEKVQIVLHHCIAAHNAFIGINWTDMNPGTTPEIRAHVYNNFIYNNTYEVYNWGDAWGYNIADNINTADTVGHWDHLYYNNLSYVNPYSRDLLAGADNGSNNLFNVAGSPVTNAYFLSLDTTGMLGVGTRQADGSLPETNFGRPASGSPLIDAGIDVFGISFNGEAPDIGWAESPSGPASPVNPVYVNSYIENANPSRLEMTYTLSLANIVPAASAFTVRVNTITRSVTGVAVSGTKVLLTLSSPVVYGDAVTVSYTKPATNPIQTTSGGQAVTIGAQTVTNRISPPVPVYVSSVIENATPSRLEMTYTLSLANIVPAASAFTVRVNTITRSVTGVAVSGTKVLLTLSSPIVYGDAVTVSYTKPATNPIQTTSGGQAVTIGAQTVTNRISPPVPVYVSSVIENVTPSRLEMTYTLSLANIVPAASSFTVTVNSSVRAVSTVNISGTKVILNLSNAVVYGDVVTVAYSKPVVNPIQSVPGGQAATIAATTVINNCSLVANLPPLVNISSPTKSTSFISPATITIDAVASDPDGTVIKVEFYNGSVKIGERTTSPYSYTWKDVVEGTYLITAAATDNKNAKTVSEAVSVVVQKSTTAINQSPVISIKSPGNKRKYNKHDNVLIEAVASDPDGTISKVELKSGDAVIAELTTAPYKYIWQDIDTGTYIITAIATDNLGATTSSTNVELTVEVYYDANSEIINLYPNPNNGHFTIDLVSGLPQNSSKVTVVTLAGHIIFEGIIEEDDFTREIDLPNSAPGTYILMVTNDQKIVTTKKFIRQ